MVDILCLIFDLEKLQPAGLLWEFKISGFSLIELWRYPGLGCCPLVLMKVALEWNECFKPGAAPKIHSICIARRHIQTFSEVVMALRSVLEFVLELITHRCVLCFRLIRDKVYQSEIVEKAKKSRDRIEEKRNKTTDNNE